MIYLDHNATSPMPKLVRKVMVSALQSDYGNAGSAHRMGIEAKKALEKARLVIGAQIGCNRAGELYFTSGGTEANNWVIKGALEAARKQREEIPFTFFSSHEGDPLYLYISSVEHLSILNCSKGSGPDMLVAAEFIAVDEDGVVDLAEFESYLRSREKGQTLISVMLANNETGVIQPVKKIAEIAKSISANAIVHTDAAQAFGRMPINVDDLGVDLMTLSAHKIGGPVGVGALYVREDLIVTPLLHGGHQENDMRAGTQNVVGAVGFEAATSLRYDHLGEYQIDCDARVEALEEQLFDKLDGLWVNGGEAEKICNTINIGFPGVDSEALVLLLSGAGIMVSNGSACMAGRPEPSHVLTAMGQDEEKAQSAIRFSFDGDNLAAGYIEQYIDKIVDMVKTLQSMVEL